MNFGKNNPLLINLALQGGGAHGAFTWGVLDYLLEDGRLEYDGISGTSAGAMNAVVFANGLLNGGADGARHALSEFWTAVAKSLPFEVAVRSADGESVSLAPGLKLMLQWSHYLSPNQLNPLDIDPLRKIVSERIDFERLRRNRKLKLYIAATNANTGKLRVFHRHELSVDTILASACLPTMHRAIEIDGEPYWDGGYSANPAIFPLFEECKSRDILMVLLTPLRHKGDPHSAGEIKSRILEIAFNSTFLREMRTFAQLQEYVSRQWFPIGRFERRIAKTHFHVIEAEDIIRELPSETKLAANKWFFEMLRDCGRERAKAWLDANARNISKRSTVQLTNLFY
ncbi:MAG: Patatin [Proteobacteria bacterium]|nr:Patatin [Pseudomonadota bacterium]